MAKYLFVPNELKPHERELGEIPEGIRLVDFLKSVDLLNPQIILNDNQISSVDENDNIVFADGIDDNYRLKEDDTLVIINQLKWTAVAWAVVKIIIAIVISYAINRLLAPDKPSIPKLAENQSQAQTEFTVNTSQNQARNGQPIPECFGTYVRTPDIISSPYRRYDSNNDQFLYMLLAISVGENTINNVFIEDTNVTTFVSGVVDYRVYKNVAAHTGNDKIKDDWNTTFSDDKMRDVVITGKEIQDYKLTVATPFNEIQLNPSDTITDLLEWDIVFSGGLYTQNADSTLGNKSVTVRLHYRNSAGTPFTQDQVITGSTRDPIRKTFSIAVTPDYYKTRAERITADSTISTTQDIVYLEKMKAYLVNNDTDGDYIEYGDMTLLAIRIKATEGVSSKGQFKVKVNATRDGKSTLKEVMEYIWTADNGGRQPISGLSLPTMTETYNNVLSQRSTVYKAIQSVGTSARYNVFPSFNIITARKDIPQSIRTMMFSEVNMVQSTLKITMSAKDETDYDGVRVIYRDPDSFEDRFSTFPLTASFPEDIPLDGVTDSVFADEQAKFLYDQDIKRNVKYQFDTELDGFVPSLFDRVGVSHPTIGKVQSGVISSFTSNTVTLNETVKDAFTAPRILFRSRTGEPSLLYNILGISGRVLTLDISINALPVDLYVGSDAQRTMYQLGEGIDFIDDIIITEIKPKKDNIISITGWNYNEEIYPA